MTGFYHAMQNYIAFKQRDDRNGSSARYFSEFGSVPEQYSEMCETICDKFHSVQEVGDLIAWLDPRTRKTSKIQKIIEGD